MAELSLSDRILSHLCEHYPLSVDKVTTMLPTFIRVLRQHMENMKKALETGDPVTVGKIGHTLKGALLNLGLAELAAIAENIETEGKAANHLIDYADLVEQLQEGLKEIV